ncbi:MAG: sugar transferase [Hungatella sp.]|nr:sugar transferase [Hungatella sp.]
MKLQRQWGFYERYVKRMLDIFCSLLALILFWWLYAIMAMLVCLKMGRPVIFKQKRPGLIEPKTGQERIFNMYKFRTMTDAKDERGKLLPDEQRLPQFGKWLRSTSLDELPELFNILKGDMSIIGPRPQLVKDMVFMSEEVRMRHTAKPGLSGLAQVMGRNAIRWEEKFKWDLKYIEHVSFQNDLRIVWLTMKKIVRPKAIERAETDVTLDYGDALLKECRITQEMYHALQAHARDLLSDNERKK